MSQYAELKKHFLKTVAAHGVKRAAEFKAVFPLGSEVPQFKLEKWLTKFLKVNAEFGEQRRYVNHFKLGADPEFVFLKDVLRQGADVLGRPVLVPGGVTRVDAHGLRLKQGLAFGEDNNGRLCEIRPAPSRSALEVTASLLVTLRWLVALYPQARECKWVCGAFIERDGLGGHVHFGRKRPTRREEVTGLDSVNRLLMDIGTFPADQVRDRRHGDARGQRYGLEGDFRLQTHGYEYRTYPSWLDSPELAFVVMTASKLAVYNPELAQMLQRREPEQTLLNFFAYYKDVDDDARLAHVMCQGGMVPKHIGGDFKGRWGLTVGDTLVPRVDVIPRCIKGSEKEVEELKRKFLGGQGGGLTFSLGPPNWSPVILPKGYFSCIAASDTCQQKGLGELIWDLCSSEAEPLKFQGLPGSGGANKPMSVPGWVYKKLSPEMKRLCCTVGDYGGDRKNFIYIYAAWREGGNARIVKKALTSGEFPLWEVGKVKPDSYKEWEQRSPIAERKFSGAVILKTGEIV